MPSPAPSMCSAGPGAAGGADSGAGAQPWLCCAGPRAVLLGLAKLLHWGLFRQGCGCWRGWAGLTLVLVGPVLPGLVGLCNAGGRLGQAGFGSGGTGTVQLQGGSCWVWLRWDWGRPAPEAALLGLASSSRIAGAAAAGGLGGIVFAAIVLVLFEDSPVSFSGAGGAARGWPSPEGGGGSGRSPPPCSGSLRLRQSERRSLQH